MGGVFEHFKFPFHGCDVRYSTVQRSGNDLGSSVHHEARLALLRRRHEDP